MPSFDLKNNGMDAEMKVGKVEWRSAVGAMEKGNVQLGKVPRVARIERGGCVAGVSISLVLAISIGSRRIPAIPAAQTATANELRGDGEDKISRPPV